MQLVAEPNEYTFLLRPCAKSMFTFRPVTVDKPMSHDLLTMQGTEDPMNATSLETLWPIFVSPSAAFSDSSAQNASLALMSANNSEAPTAFDSGISVVSKGATGLYRVRYTVDQTRQLAAQLANLDVGGADDLSSDQIDAIVEASALVSNVYIPKQQYELDLHYCMRSCIASVLELLRTLQRSMDFSGLVVLVLPVALVTDFFSVAICCQSSCCVCAD